MTRLLWLAAKTKHLGVLLVKGSVIAPLLFCSSIVWSASPNADAIVQQATELGLAHTPMWRALTHSDADHSQLDNSTLILSGSDFSPARELSATIELLYGNTAADPDQCRFPARNEWIAQQLGIQPTSLDHCQPLQEFLRKAPVDQASLIYASENISQPSSMMGHILVKISGEDDQGIEREHAISFFTDVNGINVPKIIYDSVIAGKRGFFALTPYAGKIDAYRAREQRNIWDYQLALTPEQLRMMQLHIWELKDANPSYFFDSYNCATLTYYLLATADPTLLDGSSYLMSPLDVVKRAYANGTIGDATVLPSNKWQIRMISDEFSRATNRAVKNSVGQNNAGLLPSATSPGEAFLIDTLARAYNDYLHEQGKLDSGPWENYQDQLDAKETAGDIDFTIDLSSYKNPIKAPKDGQLYAGITHIDTGTYLKIGGLPISHTLLGDNRQFFSETELRVGDLSVLVSLEDGDVELNEFQIYSATSYLPVNLFTGGISGEFRFGIEPQYDNELRRRTAGNVAGALGAAYAPVKQITLYAVANAGLGYARHDAAYVYGGPEVGMIVNAAFDMKTIIALSRTFNQIDSGGAYTKLSIEHAKRFSKSYTLEGNVNYLKNGGRKDLEIGATLKYLF